MSGPVWIVGAGPGIGASVARRFGSAGHPIGLIARNPARLATLADGLRAEGLAVATATADATDPDAVTSALGALRAEQGDPAVLCFSPLPDVGLIKPVAETTAGDLAAALALNVVGCAAAVQAVLPAMLGAGRGSLLFTTGGAAVRPSAERAVSAVVYGAQTRYVELLHEALTPRGLTVAQTVIIGAVGAGLAHEPDDVADQLWSEHAERGPALTVLE